MECIFLGYCKFGLRAIAIFKNLLLFQILPCFLHGLNTIIGKITAYPAIKQLIFQTACIVSFFNGSHYWGGQLDDAARGMNISRSMKTNTESVGIH